MKYTTAILAASAAVAKAQFTLNPNGSITCTGTNPNGAYCASDSLGSPIIIHCTNGVGQADNCSDKTAGKPPGDVYFGECWQTSATSGDAACEKNCVVYPTDGTPSFTLPTALCTPKAESTSSSATTTASSSPTSTPEPTATSTFVLPTGSTTATSTGTSVYTSAGVTVTQAFTTTYCPESTLSTIIVPSGTGATSYPVNGTTGGSGSGAAAPTGSSPAGSGSGGSSNGTVTSAAGNGGPGSSPTATPVSPKTTAPVPFTGGAIANSASAALAVVGLAVAYFL